MLEVATQVTIDLLGGCTASGCMAMAEERNMQLNVPKYSYGVSLMAVPASLEEWRSEHRTARKRSDRCERLGYRFAEIDRSQYADDILDINLSLPTRQGRPMSAGYHDPSVSKLPDYPCAMHNIRAYGILAPCAAVGSAAGDASTDAPLSSGSSPGWPLGQAPTETLVAYLTLYRVRDLALVSMILGHGSHLACDIMYHLFAGVIEDQAGLGGFFYYNRWDSGTEGLRFYKERIGFAEADVEWSIT